MAAHVTYHSSRCRELYVEHRTGELRYKTTKHGTRLSVAQFIGAKRISETCTGFSIEIVNSMTDSKNIAIGLCHKGYRKGTMPGWDKDSIGYHADDGGIFDELATAPIKKVRIVREGEVMKCCFDFNDSTVSCFRNGRKVFTSRPLYIPPGGFYPIVCLGENGQIVRLLETQAWTS